MMHTGLVFNNTSAVLRLYIYTKLYIKNQNPLIGAVSKNTHIFCSKGTKSG